MSIEIERFLMRHSGWVLAGDILFRRWVKETSTDAVALMERIMRVSEEIDHHPEVTWSFRTVTLKLWTHETGCVGPRDLSWIERFEADETGS